MATRAHLMAASFASLPELLRNTRESEPPARSHRRRWSSARTLLPRLGGQTMSRSACSAMAAARRGLPWPTLATPMPAAQSMYSRPRSS